jgi:hypothetical protein
MKTSPTRTTTFHSVVGKIVTALAFASLVGGISIPPALADDGNRQWRHDRGKHEGNRHRDRDWRYQRYEGQYYRPRHYQQPYYQPYEVYVPPPVIYSPPRSPGISLFFPIDIR